jgi:hypothetical protein
MCAMRKFVSLPLPEYIGAAEFTWETGTFCLELLGAKEVPTGSLR